MGTQPGGQDLAECVDMELDQSKQFNLLGLGGRDRQNIFVTVLCRNGEGLESVLVNRIVVDDSGPEVLSWYVLRHYDNAWVSEPLVKSSATRDIRMKVQVHEDNPMDNVRVALVETAVGLGPTSYQDAAQWSELTVDWARHAPLIDVAVTGLDLKHGSQYYLHVRTTNTVGRQTITTSPTRIFIDLTPPVGNFVATHNGASIMLEYRLDWLQVQEGDPTHSATYWQVGSRWGFSDPESEVGRWDVSVHDADGAPDTFIARQTLKPEETITLFEGLNMPHMFRYEVKVRCLNVANVWGEMLSPIVTIDRTRPHVRQALDLGPVPTTGLLSRVATNGTDLYKGLRQPELVSPAEEQAVELDFVTNLTELRVGFAAWDVESGVQRVLVAAGVAPGSTTLLGWTVVDVPGYRHARVPLPPNTELQRHLRYYVSVAAVNVRC